MFKSHWLSFLFLLPFIVLFALHNALGLSNALMVLADDYPGRDKVFGMDVQLYNLIMVIVFLLGMSAFFLHTLYVANQVKQKSHYDNYRQNCVFGVLLGSSFTAHAIHRRKVIAGFIFKCGNSCILKIGYGTCFCVVR